MSEVPLYVKRLGYLGALLEHAERLVRERPPEVPAGERGSSLLQTYWKREFKLPWREAGPPNHHDDTVDSDQQVVNT